jgi:hypothetical protein
MTKWAIGALAVTTVALVATFYQNQPSNRPANQAEPAVVRNIPTTLDLPPVIDVLDLELELALAPTKCEPFVPFDE